MPVFFRKYNKLKITFFIAYSHEATTLQALLDISISRSMNFFLIGIVWYQLAIYYLALYSHLAVVGFSMTYLVKKECTYRTDAKMCVHV